MPKKILDIEIKIRYLWKEPVKDMNESIERKQANLQLQVVANRISQSIKEALEILI